MVRYGENGKEEHVMGARSGWWGWKFFNGVMPMFFVITQLDVGLESMRVFPLGFLNSEVYRFTFFLIYRLGHISTNFKYFYSKISTNAVILVCLFVMHVSIGCCPAIIQHTIYLFHTSNPRSILFFQPTTSCGMCSKRFGKKR